MYMFTNEYKKTKESSNRWYIRNKKKGTGKKSE